MFQTKNNQQVTVIDLYSVRAETIYTMFKIPLPLNTLNVNQYRRELPLLTS